MRNYSVYLARAGIIAAVYAVFTLILAPISYGLMQLRLSESLISLAIFLPEAIPGLTLGCFLSGILGPNGIVDAILGGLATLIGAAGTYALRKHPYIAPIANVLSNGIIIGLMLCYVYKLEVPPVAAILWIMAGESVSCIGIGAVLTKYFSVRGANILKNN